MIEKEKYIVAALKDVPIFCVDRKYTEIVRSDGFIKKHYNFRFDNNYGASVIQFVDKIFSNNNEWELCVFHYGGDSHSLCYSTNVTNDVERGAAEHIDKLLIDIEAL